MKSLSIPPRAVVGSAAMRTESKRRWLKAVIGTCALLTGLASVFLQSGMTNLISLSASERLHPYSTIKIGSFDGVQLDHSEVRSITLVALVIFSFGLIASILCLVRLRRLETISPPRLP